MRLFLIISLAPLVACGPEPVRVVRAPPPIETGLLMPCTGWIGPTPASDRQLITAAAAEKRGREECNAKLATISETLRVNRAPTPQ